MPRKTKGKHGGARRGAGRKRRRSAGRPKWIVIYDEAGICKIEAIGLRVTLYDQTGNGNHMTSEEG